MSQIITQQIPRHNVAAAESIGAETAKCDMKSVVSKDLIRDHRTVLPLIGRI